MRAAAAAFCSFYPCKTLGVYALAVSGTELLLHALHEQRLWGYTGFPWHARLGMATTSILITAALCWTLYWLVCAYSLLKPIQIVRMAGAGAWVITSSVVIFTYAASWALMWKAGVFADWDTIEFGFRNLWMLYQYLWQTEPLLGTALAVGSLCGGALVGICVGALIREGRAAQTMPWRFGDGFWVVGMSVCLTSFVALAYSDPPGPVIPTPEWWKDQRPGRSLAIGYRVHPLLTAAVGRYLLRDHSQIATVEPTELGPVRALVESEPSPRSQPKLSLILIQIESLRHDVLFLEHQGREVMPDLNRLCAGGINFTRAYAASTHSNYADPAILSSLCPLRTTQHHYYSLADPWPKALVYDVAKKHGYGTAIVSSQNETWGAMDQILMSKNLDLFFDSRSSDTAKYIAEFDKSFALYASSSGTGGKLDDSVAVTRAIDWLRARDNQQQRYVLCMNLQTSHFPYQLPPRADKPFQPCEMNFIASFVKYPEEEVPTVRNAYYNALRYIDEQLGRLVAFLDQQRLREQTLIVVVGDNGECFYENGFSTHAGPPFEPAVHVPLVINCPTLEPRTDDYLTQGIDVVPTALSLMGLPHSPCFQGTNVLAEDRLPAKRRLAFVHTCTLVRANTDAVITGIGWKYVFDRKTKKGSLFDLRTDPREQTPVQAELPVVAQTLDRILRRWREVQLAYYARPENYGIYYPPPTPCLSEADYEILKQ